MGFSIAISLVWLVFALLTKKMAISRGRRSKVWLPIGLIFGPFAALAVLLMGTHSG